MSAENVEAIRRVYEAMAQGDFWAARDVFDPEIVWEWPAALAGLTGVSEYHGIEGAEAATRDFFKAWDSFKQEAAGLIDAGDDVVVDVRAHGRPKGSEREVEMALGHVWTFFNGKVIRFKGYDTPAEALEAAGSTGNSPLGTERNAMAASMIPIPGDEDLAPEALEILNALPPLNIFRVVASLPETLRPFLQLGGSLLGGSHLTPAERELAILRVAHVTGSGYERHQHEQLARAVGLSEADIEATAAAMPGDALPADGGLICRAADEITREVRLSDEALALVRERWGDPGALELILTVGYYNMVSRLLESARVPIEEGELLGASTPGNFAREGRDRLD